jgi:hypothetical protein
LSVRIRAASRADAGPISRVHVDSWRTTYEGIVPAEYLRGLSYRDRESRWNEILTTGLPASRIFVAETESGAVVGFAHGGPEREGNATYRGELYVIYLVQEHQNTGGWAVSLYRLWLRVFCLMVSVRCWCGCWMPTDARVASTSPWEVNGSVGRPSRLEAGIS